METCSLTSVPPRVQGAAQSCVGICTVAESPPPECPDSGVTGAGDALGLEPGVGLQTLKHVFL